MILYIYYNNAALENVSFHIAKTSFVPRTFLRTCTEDMLYEYSRALETAIHRHKPKVSVTTDDYEHEWLGRLTLECEGEKGRIYTEYGPADFAKGREQVDTTVSSRGLYEEMHEFAVFSRRIIGAYVKDKASVFGMDLSKNFNSVENSRYFNTENGESGMVTDIPEGRAWLELGLRKRV